MTLQQIQSVPQGFEGSVPEYIVLQTLIRLGLKPGVDFVYQSPMLGGRIERGGVVIDFLFNNPPDLAINVQGTYYHQEQGIEVIARDRMARAMLAGQGITLVFIDEDDIMREPDRLVRDALRYIDHSFLGGMGV
jgi:very-short-patch-repair endonuclease